MSLFAWYVRVRRNPIWKLAAICGLVYVLVALVYVLSGVNPTGDEPHFLVISQTLLKYHSLDVMRDYSHGDYYQFYTTHLDPHITHNASGRILPLHSIGGPILWLLPFFLLGRLGVVLFIALVSVLTVLNIYKLLLVLGISECISFRVSLTYALASPLAIYAHLTFIEPIAACICVYIVRICFEEEIRPAGLLLCSFLLGLLPLVHIRFALLEMPLFFALLYKVFARYKMRQPGLYIRYLVPVTMLFCALEVYSYTVWGTLNPAANQTFGGSVPFEVSPASGLLGMFFDQQYGLLPCFPLFFLLLAGILLTLKRRFASYHVLVLLLSLPYMLAFTSFRHWSGGWCPPARFILVLLPLYALYIAFVLERVNNLLAWGLFWLAFYWGCFYNVLTLLTLTNHGFNAEDGHNTTLALLRIEHFNITAYLPSVYVHGQGPLFALWLTLYLAITLLLVMTATAKGKWKSALAPA